MKQCDQCGKDLDRLIFCSPKCKMRWHRKAPTGKKMLGETREGNVTIGNVVPAGPKKGEPDIAHRIGCGCDWCKGNKKRKT